MKRIFIGVSAVFTLAVLAGCGSGADSSAPTEFFSPVTETPGVGNPQPEDTGFVDRSSAVGFYTDGSVETSAVFPDSGPGFVKIFRLRKRGYGTATLVRTISLAAAAFRTQYPTGDRLQIGDTSDWNGGYISGHASHQNGLDADMGYLQTNKVERDPNNSGPNGFSEIFVKNGAVTANFDIPRNWAILRNLVARGNVSRIFVDPVIKSTFCKKAAAIDPTLSAANRNEVLRRIRPYGNHADHFHMRIKCPVGHKKCVAQSEPPTGTGCTSASGTVTGMDDTRTPEQIADDELGEDVG